MTIIPITHFEREVRQMLASIRDAIQNVETKVISDVSSVHELEGNKCVIYHGDESQMEVVDLDCFRVVILA